MQNFSMYLILFFIFTALLAEQAGFKSDIPLEVLQKRIVDLSQKSIVQCQESNSKLLKKGSTPTGVAAIAPAASKTEEPSVPGAYEEPKAEDCKASTQEDWGK